MPAGRLTSQDRQHIAAGLAAGRGYADIARSLGRPTSTVTREVARNGGVAGYRAGDAQRASVRRARRRKSAPARSAPTAADQYGRAPEAVAAAFAELTAMLTQTGLPQMAASVFACLYATDSGSLTAAELVRRLRVSPASVSKAVGYLEAQELIRRERDTSGRRERYVLGGDLWYRSLLASAQRNTLLAEGARRTATILGSDTPAGARLADASEFLDRVGQEILQAVQSWWQARPSTTANDSQPGETSTREQRTAGSH
ncbi:GbsR/MarR family transcriptional regulator [Crossiella cryophila]|uniref:DNA-binding transcriptional regulator GbsR (MarR family) n=1 Tax=Crossiella cryophila TaxID=43355 RepID=A0A7W7C9W2_9PSEU|nr:helix-turn-helix domain-containing protein [Crossiella cryophila]MBB4677246.1 DNA-binding transcriptional regulator GbsR (MarR family) [Crossiella cryophila]